MARMQVCVMCHMKPKHLDNAVVAAASERALSFHSNGCGCARRGRRIGEEMIGLRIPEDNLGEPAELSGLGCMTVLGRRCGVGAVMMIVIACALALCCMAP